jgi:hypothetical protein
VEQEEPTVELYDFLYRDTSRFASYYAQLFAGKLISVEKSDSTKDVADKDLKLGVALVVGSLKSGQELEAASKTTIDPHELITTDVLAMFAKGKRLHTNLADAPHGALIHAVGTLVLVDRHMLEFANIAIDMLIDVEKKKSVPKREKEVTLSTLNILKAFLAKVPLPSTFLLEVSKDIQVVGTIKEAGMEEPISTYYFKHGTAGLAGVHLIGIKEIPSVSLALPDEKLIGVGRQAAEALSNMLFPKEGIKVTPIVMFRKL